MKFLIGNKKENIPWSQEGNLVFNQKSRGSMFWLNRNFVKSNLDFDINSSKKYLIEKKLDKKQQCKLVEEFIDLYRMNSVNEINLIQFRKGISLMEDIYDWNCQNIYYYAISRISEFNRKEDFEIFYYFKEYGFLYEEYNNIFLEILRWLNEHDEKIEKLIEEEKNNTNIELNFNNTQNGKSYYLNQYLLKKNTIVLENKRFSLKRFKEDDKDYFYQLMINLTKDKTLDNCVIELKKNKNKIILKGVSEYIEKKLNYECMSKKLNNSNRIITSEKLKI